MVESDAGLCVTGTASSAEGALAQLRTAATDVMLLDLEMPGMGGLDALPVILALAPNIRVLVVSALTQEGAEATLTALAMGAADTMLKPGPGEFTEDYRSALIARIRALGTRASHQPDEAPALPDCEPERSSSRLAGTIQPEVIAIGASTGGIHALGQLLGQFHAGINQPILVTQHLPASFMPVFARQIEATCGRPALLARDGLAIRPGSIVIASGDGHLRVRRHADQLIVQLCARPATSGCWPSVDPMLESLAEACGQRGLGVILSGMGCDGLAGARRLADAGGTILAQDAASSAVWGMPGAVTRAGLARMVASPEQLGTAIMACCGRRAIGPEGRL
jgi:two-component system chemotaxis response regulator CheB